MIGRCNRMQVLTWDQVNELINGVPYSIDLRPGNGVMDESRLENLPTGVIIDILCSPPEVPALPARDTGSLDWTYADKVVRKRLKEEDEEKRAEECSLPFKEAWKHHKKMVNKMMSGETKKKKKDKRTKEAWKHYKKMVNKMMSVKMKKGKKKKKDKHK